MTITNPTLELTYTGNSRTATITSADIVINSISVEKQLLRVLEPSSNKVELTIARSCSEVENIISNETDIKAVFKNNGTKVFTGYLSTDYSWTVTPNGEQALALTIEDVGTKLLEKEFISSGYHTFNSTCENAVRAICTVAGVTIDSSAVFPVGNVVKAVEGAATCKDLLTKLLGEFNCVYYFNNLGKMLIHEVSCTSTTGIPEFDKTKLYTVEGTAIKLTKKIRQYKNARVTYKETGTASNYLVYRNTTKDHDTSNLCYLELTAGQHFDGTEKYTPQAGVTRSPAYIEAVNAASEESLVGSNEIMVVSDAQMVIDKVGSLSASVSVAGGKYLTFDAQNSGSSTGYFRQFDIKGSIIYAKSSNVIVTADEQVATTQSNNIIEEELEWVHTKTLAQRRANLLAQFHRYGNGTYTFHSTTNVALGSVVHLYDNAISGLDVNVMLIASKETDQSDVIQYTAVAVSVFNLDANVNESKVKPGSYTEADTATKLVSVTREYAISSSSSTAPVSGWVSTRSGVTPTSASPYIWVRETMTYGDGSTAIGTPYVGEVYVASETAIYEFVVSSSVFYKNQRLTGSYTINATVSTNTSATIVTKYQIDNGTETTFSNSFNVNYANNYEKITLNAYVGSSLVAQKVLSYIDQTGEPINLGLVTSSIPTTTPSGTALIYGDYFVVGANDISSGGKTYKKGTVYEYIETSWMESNNYNKLLAGLNILQSNNINLENLGNANTVVYLNSLVANKVVANTIKGTEGFFDSIHVTGGAVFDGDLNNDAIKTRPATEGDPTGVTMPGYSRWNTNEIIEAIPTKNAFLDSTGTYTKVIALTDENTEYLDQTITRTFDLSHDIYSPYNSISYDIPIENALRTISITGTNSSGRPYGKIYLMINGAAVDEKSLADVYSFTLNHTSILQNGVTSASLLIMPTSTFSMTVTIECRTAFNLTGFEEKGLWAYNGSVWSNLGYNTIRSDAFSCTINGTAYAKTNHYALATNFATYDYQSLLLNRAYSVVSTNLLYKGQSVSADLFIKRSATAATLILSNGISIDLTSGSYLYLQGTIKISGSSSGAEVKDVIPAADNMYNVGLATKRIKNINAVNVNASTLTASTISANAVSSLLDSDYFFTDNGNVSKITLANLKTLIGGGSSGGKIILHSETISSSASKEIYLPSVDNIGDLLVCDYTISFNGTYNFYAPPGGSYDCIYPKISSTYDVPNLRYQQEIVHHYVAGQGSINSGNWEAYSRTYHVIIYCWRLS